MTSRERMRAAWAGEVVDHLPLSAWCCGMRAPEPLRWRRDGRAIRYWYSLRLEHTHALPQPWTLPDDFQRVLAWRSLGVDDVLDVSVPWSRHQDVTYQDCALTVTDRRPYRVLSRLYQTPGGTLSHSVRETEPAPPGWPVPPDHVRLLDDFNLNRALQHAVAGPDNVPIVKYLFAPPDEDKAAAFVDRMSVVGEFAVREDVAVQAWSAFGLDAVAWLTGPEFGVALATSEPRAFGELVETVAATDRARTELALQSPQVDLIVQRGWHSSPEVWPPALLDRYLIPHLRELAALVHGAGRRLAYVAASGLRDLGPRLAEAGVDVLYFVGPGLGGEDLQWAREHLAPRMTLVGGLPASALAGEAADIRAQARRAMDRLGPTGRFVLQPVEALTPDTPWAGVMALVRAWQDAIG